MKHRLFAIAALAALALAATPEAVAKRKPKEAPVSQQALSGEARYQPQPYVKFQHVAWSKDATIYQINTRQFTPEGTFKSAQAQLPRLQKLGVKILWLMPIHPIGEKNRKGSLGSPYAVKDFLGVNPEFGTLEDLKAFVNEAHKRDMKVILDWVGNHTAWDNPLTVAHSDWYIHDWDGDFRPTPWLDWSDIIDLDYSKPALRAYMTEALKYWVREADVDGYRADVAGYIPLDFWENARAELDAIKPVFMLAEWDARDLTAHAFDMTYAWGWKDALQPIAAGKADVGSLYGYYSSNESSWPEAAMRMVFTENHDLNSWDGSAPERFGPALEAALVLSFISEGMPLIYNGQEARNEKRLEFFEKDPIAWRDHPDGALLARLVALKKAHPALWNAPWGARMVQAPNAAPTKVFSFVREKGGDKVFAVFNFSAEAQTVTFPRGPQLGRYQDMLTGGVEEIGADWRTTLPAWGWRVFTTP